MTSNKHEYVWSIKDVSSENVTGEFLATQITNIIERISSKKISGLVTDGAANCRVARNLISEKFPQILSMWCIAHYLNLISKDICKHQLATTTINNCQTLVTLFLKSHIAMATLREFIIQLQIKGGGIKTSTKTRWSTIYDCCESIYRLRSVFDKVYIIKHFIYLFIF